MKGIDKKEMRGFLGFGAAMVVGVIVLNAAILVGGIWLCVTMLRWMGVIG